MAVTSRDTRQQPDLTSRFVHEFAVSDADVKACQQLRYKIFAEEMGAQIDGGEDKRDVDHFDAFCHHLIVRDRHSNRMSRQLGPKGSGLPRYVISTRQYR